MDKKHISKLSKRMYDALTTRLPHVELNGHAEKRYDGNLNLSFAGVRRGEHRRLAVVCLERSFFPFLILFFLMKQPDD